VKPMHGFGSTDVQTPFGYTDIGDVEPGDKVLSRCESTGTEAYCEVVRRTPGVKTSVYHVVTLTERGGGDTILATADCMFDV